jgi:uncharacterized surface protein with fasciclin (FAS1) repeats
MAVLAASCRGNDDDATSSATVVSTSPAPPTTAPAASTTSPGPTTTTAAGPVGPACDRFPPDGEGSLAALAQQPMGRALSEVPRLSALNATIEAAGLLGALDDPGKLTLFAPVNAAFEAIPPPELDAMVTDSAALNSVLLYHAVAGEELSGPELVEAGEVMTIEGQALTFTERGNSLVINGGEATVICSDIATANGTIHLIDAVLMPG